MYAGRYFRSLGLNIYVGYFFNHDSPCRSERHLTKKISEAAKRIAGGSTELLEIGSPEVIKEYSYAEDIIKGILKLVTQDKIFEANIGSGKGYSVENWLDLCFLSRGINWRDYTILKQGFIPDYKLLVSDPSLIFSLGWQPEVSFERLAEIMMN